MDLLFEVPLGSGARGARVALLRELSGLDEVVSGKSGPVAASELLERLLVEKEGPVLRRAGFWKLPLGERDRLIAALHARHFGDRVESIVTCSSCKKAFALDFSLGALLASTLDDLPRDRSLGPDDDGGYTTQDGRRFRLPCVEDERAVESLSPDEAEAELLRRCVLSAEAGDDSLFRAMEAAGPVLDLDVPTRCALCAAEQSVHFDMVSFFMASLARERSLLLREVHRLAAAYHWAHEDILALSRTQRRAYVALVEAERGRVRVAS